MQAQVGRRLLHAVLIILRIVAAVKGPGAFAYITVNVAGLAKSLGLTHNEHILFYVFLMEGSSLPPEALDDAGMVLAEHGGHGVPFGREFEQAELVGFLSNAVLLPPGPVGINGGVLILHRIHAQLIVLKGKAF